jgi:hypothetical protein
MRCRINPPRHAAHNQHPPGKQDPGPASPRCPSRMAKGAAGRPAQSKAAPAAPHPRAPQKHRRRIVNQLLRILRTGKRNQLYALLLRASLLLLGRGPRLPIENVLLHSGRKLEPVYGRKRQPNDLAGSLKLPHHIRNTPGPEAGRKNRGEPCQAILLRQDTGCQRARWLQRTGSWSHGIHRNCSDFERNLTGLCKEFDQIGDRGKDRALRPARISLAATTEALLEFL